MKRYIGTLVLVLLSIAQVAWAPFLMINGIIVPIFIIAVWLSYHLVAHRHLLVMVVVGGFLLDGMATSHFGLFTFASACSLLSIHLIETYGIPNKVVARFVSLLVSILIYLVIIRLGGLL